MVLFSSAAGVTAYNGSTGAWLWSAHGAVPEGTDRRPRRIYLTEGSNLVGVDPQTGRVEATASGSAVNGAAGVYVVRNGVALGLDQGGNGDAWGYDLAVQRVTLAAAGLPWPHYFVDLSGVGGSADPAGNLVIIAACTQLAPSPLTPPTAPRRPVRPSRRRRPAGRRPGTSVPPRTPGALSSPTPAQPVGLGRLRQRCRRRAPAPARPPRPDPATPPGLPAPRARRPQFVAPACSTSPVTP